MSSAFTSKLPVFEKGTSLPIQAAMAWECLNEDYWTHGLTFSQGMGWNVTQERVEKALRYIEYRLLRAIFGNKFRKKGRVRFIGFRQRRLHGNQHFHVLMAVEGTHNWTVEQIGEELKLIEKGRRREPWEKPMHVDCCWKKENSFHRYAAREVRYRHDGDSFFDFSRRRLSKDDGFFVL